MSLHGDDLLALLQGDDVKDHNGWNSETDVCDWEGIECNSAKEVVTVDVQGWNLEGTMPSELGRIRSLRQLRLAENQLQGTLPEEVLELPHLVHVDLSFNNFTSIQHLPLFTSVQLEFIKLSHNAFRGIIPSNFGRGLSRTLKVVDLRENALHGPMSPSFGTLSSLQTLDLSNNRLQGSIPEGLGKLRKLEGLFLSNNMFLGSIPPSILSATSQLKQVFLHGNYLSGTVPVSLADIPNLELLFIDANRFTGTLPQELCDLNLNEIFFKNPGGSKTGFGDLDSDNDDEMDGDDDNLFDDDDDDDDDGANDENQEAVDTEPLGERDGCSSIACPVGYSSARAASSKDGLYPCVKCPSEYYNPYLGSNKCYDHDERSILSDLYKDAGGEGWTGASNWRDSSIGVCDKEGISCNAKGDITAIRLSGMNLRGSIAEEVGFLRHLEELDLSDNLLEGMLPSSLRFAPLRKLDVSGNQLTGFVPPELCQKAGINGNGQGGAFSCDIVACGVGTFSLEGHADSGSKKCYECAYGDEAAFILGSKDCTLRPLSRSNDEEISTGPSTKAELSLAAKFAVAIVVCVAIIVYIYFRERSKQDREQMQPLTLGVTYDEVDTYDNEMKTMSRKRVELPGSSDDGPGNNHLNSYDHDPHMADDSSLHSQQSQRSTRSYQLNGNDGGGAHDMMNPLHQSLPQLGGGGPPRSVEMTNVDEWSSQKESTKEVWLDVPKIA